MRRKLMAVLTVTAITASLTGCSGKKSSSSPKDSSVSATEKSSEEEISGNMEITTTAAKTDAPTEPTTEHISPRETVTASCGSQVTLNKTISYTEGSNTVKIPLADLIQDGDKVTSFTFIIYSADGSNIGEFKGGCGISVTGDCPAATDEGWYQSENITSPTQGTYGEIKWDVPGQIQDYISPGGDLLFGYWWGNSSSIRIENVVCTYTRTADIPVDGTVTENVGTSVSFDDADNSIKIPTAGFLPENAVPEAIVYNISSSGALGKFTGAFGYDSSAGSYQSPDTAVFTDSSSLSLTWFVPAQAKAYAAKDGELILGYWWSEQPSVTLDSVTVKYSLGSENTAPVQPDNTPDPEVPAESSDFRTASEIVKTMNVGWCL